MPNLVVIGSYNRDLIFQTQVLPRPGETRMARLLRAHGGKGFNQAIAANRLGANTVFIGAIGDDGFGREAATFAEQEQLACVWQIGVQATGVASVATETSGENQILVAPGANLELDTKHIDGCADSLNNANIVLAQLEIDVAPIRRAFANTSGLRILNPAPFDSQSVKLLLPLVDIITPNETEFAAMSRELFDQPLPDDWQKHSDAQIHQWCQQLCVATVIVTLGADGVFLSGPEDSGPPSGQRVAAPQVDAVDTTGAGDCFNGALAAGLLRFGNDLSKAVDFATRAAALSVTRPGAAPAMPRLAELEVG